MTIIPDHTPISAPAGDGYEDVTVYRSGVVLAPLPGRPHFDGVQNGPAGRMARLTDGDLVIRAGLAAIDAWAEELALARRELTDEAEHGERSR